jgi:hypothetical protein
LDALRELGEKRSSVYLLVILPDRAFAVDEGTSKTVVAPFCGKSILILNFQVLEKREMDYSIIKYQS